MNRISRFYRISAPAPAREMDEAARDKYYRRLRMQAFIAATLGYSLYYVCRNRFSTAARWTPRSWALSARRCCSPMPSANSSTDSSPTTATSNASWPPA